MLQISSLLATSALGVAKKLKHNGEDNSELVVGYDDLRVLKMKNNKDNAVKSSNQDLIDEVFRNVSAKYAPEKSKLQNLAKMLKATNNTSKYVHKIVVFRLKKSSHIKIE